ncbi:MAG: hypothetical protein IKB25_09655 [Lentisphaeria bacterium]|nr:hypothetical protein [Lentisphaeria bacterium]
MNKNIVRIIYGSLLGIFILTGFLLFFEKSILLWVAYFWSVFAVIAFACAVGFWAKSNPDTYILRAAYPMVVWSYLLWTIGIAAVFVILKYTGIFTIHLGLFCLIEFILLAVYVWRLQAIDAARDEIEAVEQFVKESTITWKMIRVDMQNLEESMTGSDKNVVAKAAEAIRYADPMEHAAVEKIVMQIHEKLDELTAAVKDNKSEAVTVLSSEIEQLVKQRANKLKIVK